MFLYVFLHGDYESEVIFSLSLTVFKLFQFQNKQKTCLTFKLNSKKSKNIQLPIFVFFLKKIGQKL